MAGIDERGWIKLSRGITDNFIWDFERPKYAMAWIDMLLMANYMDKKIMFDGKVITVQRGSFITSMVKLSERWSMNRRSVKSFLDMLQGDGMITYTSTRRCTTVYITNYLAYQGFEGSSSEETAQPNAQQLHNSVHNNCTTDCTQHKKVKKDKKVKKEKKGEAPGDKRPPAPISADYSNTSFSEPMKAKVNEWLQYKQERREEYKPTGLQSLITQIQNNVNKHGEAAVMALIGDCMASNYRGITFDRLSKQQQPTGGKAAQEPIRKEPDVSWMKEYIEQRDRKRPKKAADDP